jgi:hypothetical protein
MKIFTWSLEYDAAYAASSSGTTEKVDEQTQ